MIIGWLKDMEENKYLRFYKYEIDKIIYETNENFNIHKKSEVIPKFAFHYVFSPENIKKCNVIIGIKKFFNECFCYIISLLAFSHN